MAISKTISAEDTANKSRRKVFFAISIVVILAVLFLQISAFFIAISVLILMVSL